FCSFRMVYLPIAILAHSLTIYVVTWKSVMHVEYKAVYISHSILMLCFDIYNGILCQIYTLAPLPVIMCTGLLCTGTNNFVILVFFTASLCVPYLFLLFRMHQRLLSTDSRLKLSDRCQAIVLLVTSGAICSNIFGFYEWTVDIPNKDAFLTSKDLAWARNFSANFLVLGDSVGEIGPFKN
ncbi:hypothetical protein PMAYCL1PPCAC_15856, partial [Pristionchus mayeri]